MAFPSEPRLPTVPLRWPDVIFDLQELLADYPAPVYIVGGAVRDALLGRPIKDVDLAVADGGIRLGRLIANRLRGDFFPLDPERDVGRALVDTMEGRVVFDVARFRGEGLDADLRDRDFTVNAMAVDLRDLERLIDPLNGEQDTRDKILRRCHPHAIADDPIRTLRAVRQSIQLRLRIDGDTLRDIRAQAERLRQTSPERVRDELVKILSLTDAAGALRIAERLGLLAVILPELTTLPGIRQPAPHVFDVWNHTLATVEQIKKVVLTISPQRTDETAADFALGMIVMALDPYRRQLQQHLEHTWADGRPHHALLTLAALLHDAGKGATATSTNGTGQPFAGHEAISAHIAGQRADALRLSNAEKTRLVNIVRYHDLPFRLDEIRPRTIYRFWRTAGDAGVDICLLSLADFLARYGAFLDQDAWIRFLERIKALVEAYFIRRDELVDPPPLVDGHDLMRQLELKPGPVIGELLELIREAQVEGEVQTAEEALALARRHLDARSR